MEESAEATTKENNRPVAPPPTISDQKSAAPTVLPSATAPRSSPSAAHLLFDAPDPPPELEQETLLEAGHKQCLAKLRFVLELIEAIVSVAENKTNPIAMAMESAKRKSVSQSYGVLDRFRTKMIELNRICHIFTFLSVKN